MKQHIKEQEVLSLYDEQVAKLMHLVWGENTKESVAYAIKQYRKSKLNSKRLSAATTIGKMIEILINKYGMIDIVHHNNLHIGYTIGSPYKDGKYDPQGIYSSEKWMIKDHTEEENKTKLESVYCDSLFEAIKVVIDNEKSN